MGPRSFWMAAFVAIAMAACGGCRTRNAPAFTGEWRHTSENGMTGILSEESVAVQTNGDSFRIVTKTPESTLIQVYDAGLLHTFLREENAPAPAGTAAPPVEPAGVSRVAHASESEADALRFWIKAVRGRGTRGGVVAGRETLLYSEAEKRQTGEFRAETWVDQKAAVVLRDLRVVAALQSRAITVRETWDCQRIVYGPVDRTAIVKLP